MANIINIETSSRVCGVAVSSEGMVEFQREDLEGMKHAERLAPFVEDCLDFMARREMPLDAVAVSIGPGSYTGLRIGLSLAKGLCFAKEVPLIGVSTLKTIAVKAMFRNLDWQGDEILVPMIDARRMEVFAGAYDFALHDMMRPGPVILDEKSFGDLLADRRCFFMGDGSAKFKDVVKSPNASFVDGLEPHARDMIALSEKAFREQDFIDVAYSVPEYLKEYQTTAPRPRL